MEESERLEGFEMREILFRGKRVDNGEWIEGTLYHLSEKLNPFIMFKNRCGESHEVKSETVGQYTGLTDKNGKKIFEGDVVKVNGVANAKVFYRNEECCYAFDYIGGRPLIVDLVDDRSLEVIGNIHDNPELLK